MRGDVPDDKAEIIEMWLTRCGCTLGALLEAFAERIEETGGNPDELVGHAPLWIERAQEITVERRKRPRP
jgi:hypothetical protein